MRSGINIHVSTALTGPRWHALLSLLHELPDLRLKLLPSLEEVSSVGKEERLWLANLSVRLGRSASGDGRYGRHDGSTGRSIESSDESTAQVAFSGVLGGMGVFRRDDVGLDLVLRHESAQVSDPGRCVDASLVDGSHVRLRARGG